VQSAAKNWLLLIPLWVSCMEQSEGTQIGECSDEVDNDGDGAVDCDDEDCSNRPACTVDVVEYGDSNLCINEFQASNATTIEEPVDGNGVPGFPDWIELYNLTEHAVELDGYSISDDLADPTKHVFANGMEVPKGGFLLLWADDDTEQGQDHLPFKLSKGGEELGLYNPAGEAITELEYAAQTTDWSAARFPDGEVDGWDIDTTPTPEKSNGDANQ
jgi:large repetitive protein